MFATMHTKAIVVTCSSVGSKTFVTITISFTIYVYHQPGFQVHKTIFVVVQCLQCYSNEKFLLKLSFVRNLNKVSIEYVLTLPY